MQEILLGFITSFVVVLVATPSLILVAKLKHLVDEPTDARKKHGRSVPTIGGIIIFASAVFAYALWFPADNLSYYGSLANFTESVTGFKFIVACSILIFFIGVKDDIIGVAPVKKLIGHILVGFILVVMADIRITGMQGVFGIFELHYPASVALSVFTYIVLVNAFNLIDGSDGMAAGIGFIACAFFGVWFYASFQYDLSLLAFSLAGALGAFLIYNFSPARIFMGDSGSLFIGMLTFIMTVKCIETDVRIIPFQLKGVTPAIFAMSVLAYPLIDTLRVFGLRIISGRSPFQADRNHIHHRLIDRNYTHAQTAYTLYLASIVIPIISLFFRGVDPTITFIAMGCISFGVLFTVFLLPMRKPKEVPSTL